MATGASESRLRTWERRYDVPLPQRADSGRRLYDEDDLNIIRRMMALIETGVSASEAASAVRFEGAEDQTPEQAGSRLHPLTDLFVQKASGYDHGWLLRIVRDSVYSTGWASTLERIIFPALRQLGREWSNAAALASSEHFALEVLRCEVAAELARLADQRADGGSVVLACPEGEAHEFGLLGLALLLRRRKVAVVYLGACVPCNDLVHTVRKTQARALCLSATTATGLASLNRTARSILSKRLSVQLFVGGPALAEANGMPAVPGILLPQSIGIAADRLASDLNGH